MRHKRTLALLSQCMPLELRLEKRFVRKKDGIKVLLHEEFMRVGMSSELIDVRDERMSCQGFTRDDVSIARCTSMHSNTH